MMIQIPPYLKGKLYQKHPHGRFALGSSVPDGEPAPLEQLVPDNAVTALPPLTTEEGRKPQTLVSFPDEGSRDQTVYLGECDDPEIPQETIEWQWALRPAA